MDVNSIIRQLHSFGSPSVKRFLMYRGADDNTIGVPLRVLKDMAMRIGLNNELAKSLYLTQQIDAMRLSAFIFNPKTLTGKDFEELLSGARMFLIADEVVSRLLVQADSALAVKLSSKWKHSSFSINQATGWLTLSKLIKKYPNLEFWNYNMTNLLTLASKKYSKQHDIVRYSRSLFIEAAGRFIPSSLSEALVIAKKIGEDKVFLSSAAPKTLNALASLGNLNKKKLP